MEENKAELTDKEKEEIYKKLINYICNYNEKNDDNEELITKIFYNKEYNKSPWWDEEEKKDDKIYYNQKAHIVMRILSKYDKKTVLLSEFPIKVSFIYCIF